MQEKIGAGSLTGRAMYFTGRRRVDVCPETVVRRPHEVLVRSALCGISHGTEMLAYQGQLPEEEPADLTISALSGGITYPLKYGYVNVGYDESERCLFAFYPHQDVFSVPAGDVIYLPEDVGASDAVFLANMETALCIVQDMAPVVGDTILLCGQGVVGLLVAEILKRSHFGTIIAADAFAVRRKRSEDLGCVVVDAAEDVVGIVRKFTDGRGVDKAVNVSGSDRALQTAVDSCAFGATVVEASWYGSKKVSMHLGGAFHRKRLCIVSSQVSTVGTALTPRWDKQRRMETAIDLVRLIRPAKYITQRFALNDASDAFALIAEHPEETIQVVLEP